MDEWKRERDGGCKIRFEVCLLTGGLKVFRTPLGKLTVRLEVSYRSTVSSSSDFARNTSRLMKNYVKVTKRVPQ